MVRNTLDEAINNICEASGCQAIATEKLSVTAGPFGVITRLVSRNLQISKKIRHFCPRSTHRTAVAV